MSYTRTGTARSLTISVNKKVGGNQVQGYPNVYYGQLAGSEWGNPSFAALTDEELQRLSDTDFNTRYDALVAYIESVEGDNLDFDTDIVGDGAAKYDLTLCGTTTTTEAPPSYVYPFTIQYGKFPVDVCTGTTDTVYSSTASPVVGTVLYKDLFSDFSLGAKWNVTNGEHMRFLSPALHGGNAVQVSLTTGKILSITSFNCAGTTPPTPPTTIPPTTTTAAPTVLVDVFNDSEDPNTGILDVNINNISINGISFPISDGDAEYGSTTFTGYQNISVEVTTTTGVGRVIVSGTNELPGSGSRCVDISDYGAGTHDLSFPSSVLFDPNGTYRVTIILTDGSC